jgi:thiamine biosynthesis lipoprotein
MPSPSPATEVRRARPLLGTLVEIRAAGPGGEVRLHAAIDAAFAAVERVQSLMSFHDPGSELSALNREAARRPLAVDARTYEVLAAALELSRRSQGAFDICVAPRLEEWGYLPAAAEPAAAGASWTDIELLDARRVRFHRPLRIDLGGIAKGYAVDRAVAALRAAGIESGLVNAGGDLRAFGAQPWSVVLRHPQSPAHSAHSLELRDEALATSANYFSRRHHGAGEVSPLLDPHSGRPWLGAASVSVRAPDCLHADALTKVVLFAAPEVAEQTLAHYDAQAYVQHSAQDVIPAKAGIQGDGAPALDAGFRRHDEGWPCSA